MKTKMQKLSTRRLSDAPADSLVRGNCGSRLNKEETLSDAGLKTVDNNPEESLLSGRRGQNPRVFVLNMRGKPLMPTTCGKARKLVRQGRAKVVKRTPFTIQLTYATGEAKQDIALGVDTGYKNVGLSVVSSDKELFSSEVKLRTDIPKLLSEKRQYRRTRRNKLWYRPARFLNRTKNKKHGWLAPSVEHRLNSHVKAVNLVKSLLPVSEITVEVAAFDIQKIKNPGIARTEYQSGEQKDFWNVREYALHRDGHRCSHCGKGDTVLNVHHIESRQTGGDRPDNLITLCEKCHKDYHRGKIELRIKRSKGFKAETVMSILRWKIVERLRELGNVVNITYGYITKSARIAAGMPKTHSNDAFCIAGGNGEERTDIIEGSFARRNNRSLQLNRKGFKPSIRRQRYEFQPKDLVRFAGNTYTVKGMQNLGKYIKLSGLKKPVKTDMVSLIKYGRGLQFIPAL